ncbi:fatty acid desaturase [Stieleria sp. TO1_6]|uniref:fatty acid desaturase family protein n=1 Tax=Stieleria tagensis TaxID=2956795 RepID=UPI00209B886E|nr:fatty acid desaturase [Stieleria tagensis]MCO8125136.1 fatty acid desaturase [Stieleria tagensis]
MDSTDRLPENRCAVSVHGVSLAADQFLRLHSRNYQSLVRFVWFALLYAVAIAAVFAIRTTEWSSLGMILVCLPLYLVAAASLHGISLFTHEAVHGVLANNPTLNRWGGILCALPVLQNFSAYRVLHLDHHAHLGATGDPDHYDNYSRWTWLVFLMHWGRLIIGYPVYITMIPILGYRQADVSERRWIAFESGLVIVGLAAAVVWLPTGWMIHAWLIPMILINTMVNIRGMSQHTFLEHPDDPIRGTRSILTNPVTKFFMCNENYHLEHHLFPGVPWHNLCELHAQIGDQLESRQAPFVASYFEFVCEFIRKSWLRSPLGRRSST